MPACAVRDVSFSQSSASLWALAKACPQGQNYSFIASAVRQALATAAEIEAEIVAGVAVARMAR